MTARILVVVVLPNVKLLEAKLSKEYYDVLTATNELDTLEIIEREVPDIIFLAVMTPDMDGFEVCARPLRKAQCPCLIRGLKFLSWSVSGAPYLKAMAIARRTPCGAVMRRFMRPRTAAAIGFCLRCAG